MVRPTWLAAANYGTDSISVPSAGGDSFKSAATSPAEAAYSHFDAGSKAGMAAGSGWSPAPSGRLPVLLNNSQQRRRS